MQLATKSFPESIEEESTEEFGDDFFETAIDQRHPSELEAEALAAEAKAKPPAQKPVVNSAITTAAALAVGQEQPLESGLAEPAVSPDLLTQGMAVVHPDHGLGKIVALSGAGKNRRATVRFVTAGQKRFVIAHSPLRLASK